MKRSDPDYSRLNELLLRGAQAKDIMNGDEPAFRRISKASGHSVAMLHSIVRRGNRPSLGVLISLADYFGDMREDWLEAGGFDVASLPKDRGYTTLERDIIRDFLALDPENQVVVQRTLRLLRSDDDGA